MGIELKQTDTGHLDLVGDLDSAVLMKYGGPYVTPNAANPGVSGKRVYKFPLAAGTDTAGGIVSFANPYSYDLILEYMVLDVTTVATGACTVSVGETGTNGTTLSSNFISGQDVHSATGTFNSGMKSIVWPAGKWITASTASGASAGLVGNLYCTAVLR